jgi:hypothetical protein
MLVLVLVLKICGEQQVLCLVVQEEVGGYHSERLSPVVD